MLANVTIVLINTTHPGNIGASARAMKTMGLKNLTLVKPMTTFPSAAVTARAAGADSVLQTVQVVDSLSVAVADCGLVIGTGAELRSMPLQHLNARSCAELVCQQPGDEKIALVFGTERSGMSNADLALCHRQVVIPTAPEYNSLNLAAAVQVITYELFMAATTAQLLPLQDKPYYRLATSRELQNFYAHLEQTLIEREFIKAGVDKKIMPRLQRLFNRASLERREINLLRGILNAVQK